MTFLYLVIGVFGFVYVFGIWSWFGNMFMKKEKKIISKRRKERKIPMQMSDSRDKIRLRRPEKPRPPTRWDTRDSKENFIEISDDEEDDIRILNDLVKPISAQSFYKSRNENRWSDLDRNLKDVESVEDDDDVLYVTCIESNEAKAEKLGFKKTKEYSKSPIVLKDSLLRPNLSRISKNYKSRNESYSFYDKLKYQELLRQLSSSCFGNVSKISPGRKSTSFWNIPLKTTIDSRSRYQKLLDSVLNTKYTPLFDLTAGDSEPKRIDF